MKQGLFLLLLTLYTHAAGFSQISRHGLSLWLKADAGITTNAGSVTEWKDQSGNDHHATVTPSLNAPQYLEKEINGRPAVRFDGKNIGM